VMMTILTFFFGRALKELPQDIPYPVYVLSGLVIWNLFSTGLTGAAQSMVNNALIINKIYFPRLVIPVAAVLVSLFDFIIAFVLLIVMLIWYHQEVALSALLC